MEIANHLPTFSPYLKSSSSSKSTKNTPCRERSSLTTLPLINSSCHCRVEMIGRRTSSRTFTLTVGFRGRTLPTRKLHSHNAHHDVTKKEWSISSSSWAATSQTTQFRGSIPSPSYENGMEVEI